MNNKSRFYFHHIKDQVFCLEIKRSFDQAPAETPTKCPCCENDLTPLADICQLGLFDDRWITFLGCLSCCVALEFVYQVANYDLVSKRDQKKWNVLLSKKPAEGGKGKR